MEKNSQLPAQVIELRNNPTALGRMMRNLSRSHDNRSTIANLRSSVQFMGDVRWRLMFAIRGKTITDAQRDELVIIDQKVQLLKGQIAGLLLEIEHDV